LKGLPNGLAGAALCAALCACGGAGEQGDETSANEVAQQLAQVRIEPGMWERSTDVLSVSAEGMPREAANRLKGRRSSSRHCITREQAARPNATFMATRQNSDCTYRDFTMQGGRVSGNMACSNAESEGIIRTAMSGEYGPQSYDMRMRVEAPMSSGQIMTTEVRVRGRRVGACEGGSGQ
jgi:hypothetical protein